MLSRVSRLLLKKQQNAVLNAGRAFGSTKFVAGGGHHAGDHTSHGPGDHGHGSHGHHADEPHVPEFYDRLGKFMLITAYLWIFYRLKEDKGQLFGFYQPWLHEHEHEEVPNYQDAGDEGDSMPTLPEREEDDEEHGGEDEEEEH